jgi:hypothetical protein
VPVEVLEGRLLLTFAASLSGPIKGDTAHDYAAYVHRTGSQTATSETFRFDDGTTVPITNPAVLQAATHRYIEPSFRRHLETATR